jgi:hypothetical protein
MTSSSNTTAPQRGDHGYDVRARQLPRTCLACTPVVTVGRLGGVGGECASGPENLVEQASDARGQVLAPVGHVRQVGRAAARPARYLPERQALLGAQAEQIAPAGRHLLRAAIHSTAIPLGQEL